VLLLAQVLLSGNFVPPSDLDLPKWAAWLASNGYRNKQGWNTLMAGIKVTASSSSSSTVSSKRQAAKDLTAAGRHSRAAVVMLP
jgi:hypothetical protein